MLKKKGFCDLVYETASNWNLPSARNQINPDISPVWPEYLLCVPLITDTKAVFVSWTADQLSRLFQMLYLSRKGSYILNSQLAWKTRHLRKHVLYTELKF